MGTAKFQIMHLEMYESTKQILTELFMLPEDESD